MKTAFVLLLLNLTASAPVFAQPGATLARIRARNVLLCGVDRSEAEYSSTDEHGSRTAFDRDLCRAVAIAALGPDAHVIVTFYADDPTSLQALARGKADLIASVSMGSPHRGIGFSAPILYDPTGLLVPRAANIHSALQLSGKKICFLAETQTEDHLRAWFAAHHADLLPFPFQEEGEMEAAFVTNNCVALAGDLTRLAQTRISAGSHADDFIYLPETLGDDTLALAYRLDDPEWKTLVDDTRNALVAAEEKGTTSTDSQASPVIAAVGNYAELFDRNLGTHSPAQLPRGQNALTENGGRLHSRPQPSVQ